MDENVVSDGRPQQLADVKVRVDEGAHRFLRGRWKFLRAIRTPAFDLLLRYLRPKGAVLVALSALNVLATLLEALRLLLLLVVLGMLIGDTAIRDGAVTLAGFQLPVPFVDDLSGTRGLAVGVAALAALTVLKESVTFAAAYLAMRVQAFLTYEVRRDLMDKLLRLELGYFSSARAGDVSYLQNTVVNRVAGLLPVLQQMLAAILDLVVAVGMLLFISTRLTLVLAVLSLVLFALVGRMRFRTARLSYATEIASRDASTYYLEAVQGIRLVKLAGRDGRTRTEYLDRARHLVDRTLRQLAFQEFSQALTRVGAIGVLLIAAFGLYLVARSDPSASAGIGIGFVYVAYRAVSDLSTIAGARLRLSSIVPQFMMVADFLLDTESEEHERPGRTVSAVSRLDLDHVEFGYGDGPPVVDMLSLSFDPGTVTAIVGASGSGKTTVLELLAGFRMPRRGRMLVDGVDLAELDLDSYRRRIGYASQEAILFHGGALENVRFLRPTAPDAEVERAIELACAEEFLGREERDVGEHGRKLSGGQRQRVALARVFLQDPDVLLLDEATNALDLATEARLYENLLRLRDESKIVVVVAHRLSALTAFDRIVVLHDGHPAEVGTHEELMAAGGIYYHLFSLQQLEPERPREELRER